MFGQLWRHRQEAHPSRFGLPIHTICASSAGIGLARLGRFHTQAEVAAGRLVTVLEDFNPGDIEAIHAVYLGQGGFVPARMRAFIDFLARNVKIRA